MKNKKTIRIADLYRAGLLHVLRERGITQKELAEATNTKQSYLSEFLNEQNEPIRERRLAEWSNYLGKSFVEMLELGGSVLSGNETGIIRGNNNVQNVKENIFAAGDVSTKRQTGISPELNELVELLHDYANRAEIKQLIKKYRAVKQEYEK